MIIVTDRGRSLIPKIINYSKKHRNILVKLYVGLIYNNYEMVVANVDSENILGEYGKRKLFNPRVRRGSTLLGMVTGPCEGTEPVGYFLTEIASRKIDQNPLKEGLYFYWPDANYKFKQFNQYYITLDSNLLEPVLSVEQWFSNWANRIPVK